MPVNFLNDKMINLPPSRAGIGNILKIAKLTEIEPIKYKIPPGPAISKTLEIVSAKRLAYLTVNLKVSPISPKAIFTPAGQFAALVLTI